MLLIDAHIHVGMRQRSHSSAPVLAERALELLVEDMDRAEVTTSLVVTRAETVPALVRETVRHPGRLYSLFWYNSREPDQSFEDLRVLADSFPAVLVGVKTSLPYVYKSPLQREFFALYEFCQDRQLPIQFHFGGNPQMESACHPSLFATLSQDFPELAIVCLHAGGGWYREMPGLLATYPNVYLEVEALQLHEAELHLPPQVLPYLLQHCESRKLLFGSDRIGREEKFFRRVEAIRHIPPLYRDDLCHRTATRLYQLPQERLSPVSSPSSR